jgi:hypothetical protein
MSNLKKIIHTMRKMLFGAMLAMLVSSCINYSASASVKKGSGKSVESTFSVSTNYTSLTVTHGITVKLVPAGSEGAGKVTCDELALEFLSITEKNGKVEVSYKPDTTIVMSDVETTVVMPLSDSLAGIEAVGAAKVECEVGLTAPTPGIELVGASRFNGDITAERLQMELVGASRFNGKITTNVFEAEIVGASTCEVDGSVDECKVEAVGASHFRGYGLTCRSVKAEAVGASGIEITATESLDAEAVGASSVKYKGSPASVVRDASGASSVKAVK